MIVQSQSHPIKSCPPCRADEVSQKLAQWARTLGGVSAVCIDQYAEALELVPYTLAENAGLQPVEIVTKLRAAHAQGDKFAGINVKKGCISNMYEANDVPSPAQAERTGEHQVARKVFESCFPMRPESLLGRTRRNLR